MAPGGTIPALGKVAGLFLCGEKTSLLQELGSGHQKTFGFARIVLLQLATRELERVRPVGTNVAGKCVLVQEDCEVFSRLRSSKREFVQKQVLILHSHEAFEILGACSRAGSFSLLGVSWLPHHDAVEACGLSRWRTRGLRRWLALEEALQTKEAPLFYRKDGQDMWLLG